MRRDPYTRSIPTIRPVKQTRGFYWQAIFRFYDSQGKETQIKKNLGIEFMPKRKYKKGHHYVKEDATKSSIKQAMEAALNTEFLAEVDAQIAKAKEKSEKDSDPFVDEYIRDWLARKTGNTSSLRMRTKKDYEHKTAPLLRYFENHRIKLKDLKRKDITAFLRHEEALFADKKTGANLNKKYKFLRMILIDAEEAEILTKAPKLPKSEVPPIIHRDALGFLYDEQLKTLYNDYIKGSKIETIFYLCWRLGLRREGALGLLWDAVDLDNATVTICRSYTLELEEKMKSKNGFRVLPLAPDLVDYLRSLKKQQTIDRALCGAEYKEPEKNYVVRDRDGSQIKLDYASRKFSSIFKKAHADHPDWQKITLHGLRRSLNVNMERAGYPASVRAAILGDDENTLPQYNRIAMSADAINSLQEYHKMLN